MTDHVDRFYAALTVLAGHGHVKQRLMKAFGDYLAEIHEDELPPTAKHAFAELNSAMHRVSPLNGEGPICASIRKMSLDEASDCAARIVSLYGEVVRCQADDQIGLPLGGEDKVRVPPFLVKSV